jgi:signal transduction histidine kinase
MSELVVEECKMALDADATCIFLQGEDGYDMTAERGCTAAFKAEWRRIPSDILPRLGLDSDNGGIFVGTADALKCRLPDVSRLVDASRRKLIAYAALRVNGKPIGMLAFSYNRDIQVHIDQNYLQTILGFCAQALERVRLTEREQIARQQAEAASQAKTSFLANVSHEIRTPIGVIQGFADLLLESKGLSETQRHWASVIRRNTQQLTGLVGEVLDISKIEAEKVEMESIEFSLPELLADLRTTAEFKAQEKGIQFLFECGEIPEWIRSDPTRLRQILVNLVGNAIKFTVQGHVKVRVHFNNPGLLEIEVRDTGIGISEDKRMSVFDPFTQADTSTRREFGGTGLGLTIAKRLAQALGGDVVLKESSPDKGSTFVFQMRCERCEAPGSPPSTAGAEGAGSDHELEGLKILLVEDSIDNQDLICNLLAREGASVDVADSGVSGVKKAMSNQIPR